MDTNLGQRRCIKRMTANATRGTYMAEATREAADIEQKTWRRRMKRRSRSISMRATIITPCPASAPLGDVVVLCLSARSGCLRIPVPAAVLSLSVAPQVLQT